MDNKMLRPHFRSNPEREATINNVVHKLYSVVTVDLIINKRMRSIHGSVVGATTLFFFIALCCFCVDYCIAQQKLSSNQAQRSLLIEGRKTTDRSTSQDAITTRKRKQRNRTKRFKSLQKAIENQSANEKVSTEYDIFSRQKDQNPTDGLNAPSIAPIAVSNDKGNNDNDGDKQKGTTTNAPFTVAPVSVPIAVVEPTIAPVIITTTDQPILSVPLAVPPTPKPIVSIPLAVSPVSPTTYPTLVPSASPTTTTTTATPTNVPLNSNNTDTAVGNDVVLDNNETAIPAQDDTSSITNTSTSSSNSWTMITVIVALSVSMILSILVFKTRHNYVKKYGAASTRKRKREQQQQQQHVEIVDDRDHMNQDKTVHIVSSNTTASDQNDNNNGGTTAADQTFEIRVANDEDLNIISSQEDSFLSSSEQETDLEEILVQKII